MTQIFAKKNNQPPLQATGQTSSYVLHVYLARILLKNIMDGNGITIYEHTNGPVIWNPDYVSITDCSGFINALLKKSYNLPPLWTGVKRPYASTYYHLINEKRNFIKITNINNARIGDFIVFRILPGTTISDNTGHIMLINDIPNKIITMPPVIGNTVQWAINIIDQSSSHGSVDSRYIDQENKTTGLGTGFFRIYTNSTGELQGYAWSISSGSKYIDKAVHPLVIGRLNLL